jgi:hypothetical protein
MVNPHSLAHQLEMNHHVILRQLNGLKAEDSFLQPALRGNCINWILGHVLSSRQGLLRLLGLPAIWTEEEIALYKRGSAAITSADDPHLPYERLLADLETTQQQLVTALLALDPQTAESINGDTSEGLGALEALCWHESYHAGQFEYLRQLTGVNDRVIG